MSFQVTTALRKLAKLENRIRVIPGGTWAGKTYDIIALEIDYAIKHPGTEITFVGATIPSVKAGVLKDFKQIMRETGRWIPHHYNATDRIYTFANGSTIQCTAFDDEDKARQAGKRNRLFVNEVNTISKSVVDALMIRTDGVIWLDYNPTARFWVDNELVNSDGVDYLILTYRDNEALPQTILDELERRREKAKTSDYWSNWCAVYLDGKVGRLEGVCLTEWQEIKKLPEEARILCYGLDFGYTNDPSSLMALYKWNDGYILDEVFYKKGLLNSDISNLLKSYNVNEYVYADSAEPKSIDELRMYGHKVEPVAKGRDSVVYGINLMNQNKIWVTSRSTNMLRELQSYVWQKDKDGTPLNKPVDAFNHAIDASRYAMMEEISNPNKGVYHIYTS